VVADMADRVIVMYAGRIVEEAPVADLFGNPRHPYTYLLLRSVPRLDDPPGRTLPQIEGTVPTAASLGSGCRFNSRCPLADDRCRVEEPPLSAIDGGPRRAACFHVDRLAALEAT
jgi:peptide/nickel transport system ATP-binding protein